MSTELLARPGTLRPMLGLAMPVLAEQMLHLSVEYVDLYLTGNYLKGPAYVAAMGLMAYSMWLVVNLFGFITYGATALTARSTGAGDAATANRAMHQALLLGAGWSVLLMLLALPSAGAFVRFMKLDAEAAVAAQRYLTIELSVLPAIMVETVGIACLRGAGDTVSGLVTMAIVNLINIVVSFTLAVGAGPFPQWGWDGIAAGTAVGHVCGAAIILTLLVRGRAGYALRLRSLQLDRETVRRILRVGVPGGIDVVLIVLCHMVYVRMVNQLGVVAAAAHGVAIQIEALAYMPGSAFQVAASTLAGQYLGARQPARAVQSVVWACACAFAVMAGAGVVFYTQAPALAQIFLKNENAVEVLPTAVSLLKIAAVIMLPLSIAMVLGGALRGAGDTRWPLAFTLIGFLAFRIPLAYVFAMTSTLPMGIAGFGWGVEGAWYAACADVTARCLLFIARFIHGGWQRVAV